MQPFLPFLGVPLRLRYVLDECFPQLRSSSGTVLHQQHGAGEARRAHNPEVTGSKPVAAIKVLHMLFEGQAAGLHPKDANYTSLDR
ncbi:hypothetical protein AB1N83_008061 [Pleurotus pulmonarius]